MKRRRTAAEQRHFDRLTDIPCLVCGAFPIERHHVTARASDMGRIDKRDDRVVPLCARHHRCGSVGGYRDSVEALGHRGFFSRYGIDLLAEAERLWIESQAIERRAA